MSTEALSTQPFSMGSSSIALPGTADCMDMSLEDLIKARRNAITEQKKQSPLKSNNNSQAKKNNKKVNAVQKSIGSNKAKRNAKTAARRGLSSNSKPDPHAVEREVYRQQRRAGANGGGAGDNAGRPRSSGQPRRSNRIQSNKTEADRKTKAKNLANERKKARLQQQKNNSNNNKTSKTQQLTAPPKKAVNAAMKAMNSAGFTAPKGMKMVISFEPSQKKVNNNGRRGQGGGNQRGKKH